jgi:RNA-directed DNA polymerase
MTGKRTYYQTSLDFDSRREGEALSDVGQRTETAIAECRTESPTDTEQLMEEVCESENLQRALTQVKANKGSPGVDGMSVERLPGYLRKHWLSIREQLLTGTYKPLPVKRVTIPKPSGGTRNLGIPTVLDRFIQQAILQVLQPRWDPTFSERSYGFRPGRSAHQAIGQAQSYIAEGYGWVVDVDIEKFFDQVNHDRLMSTIAKRVSDKRLLKLIRAFLNAGVMENGLVIPMDRGTPQGGPLSPLLSNLVLDELDEELKRRGHRFVRYADDCNIYVRSQRAGERVMTSVTRYIEQRLKLKVNAAKSAVARAGERKFLSFCFEVGSKPIRCIAPQALARFRKRVRELTHRHSGKSFRLIVGDLSRYLRGWGGYFGYCETPVELARLNSWVRRRMRAIIWHRWKTPKNRQKKLKQRGVAAGLAHGTAWSNRGVWRLSHGIAMSIAFPTSYFSRFGLPQLCPVKR